MTRSKFAMAALLAGAVLVGCDSKSDSTTTPPATPPPVKPQADSGTATPVVPPAMSDAAAKAQASATDMTAKAQTDAAAQLTQVMQYIKDNKYDLADQSLSKLEANKASFPDAIQKQIESARSALTAAKSSGGMKMPDMPNMGK